MRLEDAISVTPYIRMCGGCEDREPTTMRLEDAISITTHIVIWRRN